VDEVPTLFSIQVVSTDIEDLQINIVQLQLLQARLDSSRNVVDVIVVDLGRDVQLLTRNATLFDRGAQLSFGLVYWI
jgi:hypothetical protein